MLIYTIIFVPKKNAREKTKQEDVLYMASKNKADTMLMKYGYYKVICL